MTSGTLPGFAPRVPRTPVDLHPPTPLTVGSFGDSASLREADPAAVREACDLVEIRLDLLAVEGPAPTPARWAHLRGIPLLFTARRGSEGGAGDHSAEQRMELLRSALDDAALIDIEVASIPEMRPLIEDLKSAGIPWIASFHDFVSTSTIADLNARRMAARNAGAAGFKAAIQLGWDMGKLAPLCFFVRESAGFPVSLMGMGPLAPVSRVLFAQLGSVLNYGYLGATPTAPGQWSARQLKEAIASVERA